MTSIYIDKNQTYDGNRVEALIDSAYDEGVKFGRRIGKREAEVKYEAQEHKKYERGYENGYNSAGADLLELASILRKILNILE